MTAATDSGIAPRCTGMCSAWATIFPSASKSAAEQSRRSLMFEEYAPRMRTAPISSATPARALARTERVTGSRRSAIPAPQHQAARLVDATGPPGRDHARGLGELDQGRPARLAARSHLPPIEHVDLDPLPLEARPPPPRANVGFRRLILHRTLVHPHRGELPRV